MRRPDRLIALGALLLLAACGGRADRPAPAAVSARPALGGTVKIGKPYQVFGVWYYPSDDRAYDEKGVASWYGPGFHALNTANGERYNQDDLTAAHKTLPMPSWVEVENIDNGRRLTVRVNDRGPFVAGRIIDLSRASAQLLGVDRPGTARVRVRRVFPDGAQAMVMAPAVAAAPSLPVAMPVPPTVAATAAVPPVITVALPASVTSATLPAAAPVAPGAIFVQVAALSDPGRIAWLKGYLSVFGPVVTETAPSGLTRVRLGPYSDAASAGAALAQLRRAGYNDARLIPAGGAAPKP